MNIFFENVVKSDTKPAILQILKKYVAKFRPKSLDTSCKPLKNIYLDSCLNMPFKDLQKKRNEFFYSISIPQEKQ